MDKQQILEALRRERDSVESAIQALEGASQDTPLYKQLEPARPKARTRGRKPGKKMSPEARQKIASAQKKRWAKQKASEAQKAADKVEQPAT